jgi:hypothetical protein
MPSVVIDMVTVALALYATGLSAKRCTSFSCLLPLSICITYLVAQSGWTASFLTGNLWGADYNNYIWFLFNTLVFVHIIKKVD